MASISPFSLCRASTNVCPKDVKKNALETCEEVGSEARERGVEGGFVDRASSGSAAKEDKGRVN